MSAFMELREVSVTFQNDLQQVSTELFSVKIGDSYEQAIANKFSEIKLLSSKLKLLRAVPTSLSLQAEEQDRSSALQLFEERAVNKILEQMTVKSTTQAHAVKTLLTTPDNQLDPKRLDRKKQMIEHLNQFCSKETQLQLLENNLKEKEKEFARLREEWSNQVEDIREESKLRLEEDYERGPLYDKICNIVCRLELMRWLVGRVACSRGTYDWLRDSHGRLATLTLTRVHNTVDMFVQ